jgi:hypothetical protein
LGHDKRNSKTAIKEAYLLEYPPCIPLKANRRFEGKCDSYLHVSKISQARNQYEADRKQSLLHAGFLLGLFFYPEDGGDVLLRNVC